MKSAHQSPLDSQDLDRLRALLRDMGSVVVTFSGGVDSALLVALAVEQLGDRAVALTADSVTFPPEELAETRRLAAQLGARHVVVESHELQVEGYAANQGDRCYYCKTEMFDLALAWAKAHDVPWVVDGTLVDDLGGHRPGQRAAQEHRVRQPLVEAGFTKAMVREAARWLSLDVWDKPALACLGSRFPVGSRVTEDRVLRVGRVESWLHTVGLRQLRVRWHELEGQPMVRLEVEPSDMARLSEPGVREALVEICEAEGFQWVTLDLKGYRMGSLSHAFPATGS